MKIWVIIIILSSLQVESILSENCDCCSNYSCNDSSRSCRTCHTICQRKCRTCDCSTVCRPLATCTDKICSESCGDSSNKTSNEKFFMENTTLNNNMKINMNATLKNIISNTNIVNSPTNVNSNTVDNIKIITNGGKSCIDTGTTEKLRNCTGEPEIITVTVRVPVPVIITIPVTSSTPITCPCATCPCPPQPKPCPCTICPCPTPPRCCITVIPCIEIDCNPYRYECGYHHCRYGLQYLPRNPCDGGGCIRKDNWVRKRCDSSGYCRNHYQDCSECGDDFYLTYSKFTRCRGCYSSS